MLRLLSELNTPTEQQVYAIFSREFPSRPARTWAEAAEALTDINNTADVWLTLNPRRVEAVTGGRYGTVSDVVLVNGFAGDVDFGQVGHQNQNHPPTREAALAVIKAVEIKATLIIETGGGFAPVVLFERPIEVNFENRDRLNALCRRYSNTFREAGRAMGWAVDGGKSIAQIIRVPGTVNRKYDPPRPVTIHEAGGKRYTLEELEALLPAVVERPTREFTGTVPTGLDANDLRNLPCIKNAVDNSWTLPRDEWLMAGRAICHCDNGPEVFQEISRPYKGYSKEAVDAQIADIIANMKPPLCESIFYDFGGEFCKECPHCETGSTVAGKAFTNFLLNSPITFAAQKAHEREESKKVEDAKPRLVSARELRNRPPENLPPLIMPDLGWRKTSCMLLTGETGIGKSFYALELAYALAEGSSFMGLNIVAPQRVILIQSENDAGIMRERMDARVRIRGGNEDNLFIVEEGTMAGYNRTLVDKNGVPTGNAKELEELLATANPDVIIFDPLADFHNADENHATMSTVMKELIDIGRNANGAAVVIVHHHGKPMKAGEGHKGKNLSRGSTGIIQKGTVILTLTQKEGQDVLAFSKVRGRRSIPEVYGEKRDGVVWHVCERHSINGTDILRVFGNSMGAITSKTAFVNLIRQDSSIQQKFDGPVPTQTVEKAIDRVVESGDLVVVRQGRNNIYMPRNSQTWEPYQSGPTSESTQ